MVFKRFFLALSLLTLFQPTLVFANALNSTRLIEQTSMWTESLEQAITNADKINDLSKRIDIYIGLIELIVNNKEQPLELRKLYYNMLMPKVERFIDRELCRLGTLVQNNGEQSIDEQALEHLSDASTRLEKAKKKFETQQSFLKNIWSKTITKVAAGAFGCWCFMVVYRRMTKDKAGKKEEEETDKEFTIDYYLDEKGGLSEHMRDELKKYITQLAQDNVRFRKKEEKICKRIDALEKQQMSDVERGSMSDATYTQKSEAKLAQFLAQRNAQEDELDKKRRENIQTHFKKILGRSFKIAEITDWNVAANIVEKYVGKHHHLSQLLSALKHTKEGDISLKAALQIAQTVMENE